MARQPGPGGHGGGGGPQPPQTQTQRAWKGLNLTDSRLTLDEDELYRCENAMPLGRGIAPTPLYNGPAGTALYQNSLIKESLGCALTYAPFTVPHPVIIAVFEDGSAWMRDLFLDGAVDVQIASVGRFSASPSLTSIVIWQDGPVLIQDDVAGYFKWDGVVLTLIDATKTGHSVSVFSGYTFLLTAPRSITFTAPNTFSDFTVGNGAGSFKITDDAFQGAVQRLISTVSQLWIVGASAIDALGNIATAAGVTTFSVTNAVATIGSAFGDSVIGYYRSLVFATGYSIHSLLGVTPQKLSGKIDQLFAALAPAISSGPRAGVVKLNALIVLAYCYHFLDPITLVNSTKLLCFSEGKWFLTTTPDLAGRRVLDIVSLTVRTEPELYGIDTGGFIYRIFARPTDARKGTVTIASKLSDAGAPIEGHQAFKVGFDLSAPAGTGLTALTVTLATEATTVAHIAFIPFLGAADAWLGVRYALYRIAAPITGQRLGWTLSYPCADQVTLDAAHLEAGPTADWEPVSVEVGDYVFTRNGAAAGPYVFTNADGSAYRFLNA